MREYRPNTASRKVSMLERVMEEAPASGESFGDWFFRWLEIVRACEEARQKMLDDDIKCAVVIKRAPKELKEHLV